MKYQLEKYKGKSSRHKCPSCGDKKSFAYYRGEDGSILDVTVGRCNHEVSCGYHYTPSDWFRDHPDDRRYNVPPVVRKPPEQPKKALCTVPMEYVSRSRSYSSNFVKFLCGILSTGEIESLMHIFHLGATRKGEVIFWEIDAARRCRSGKIIQYDPETGHRIKDKNASWVHSILKYRGVLPEDWELTQCLFGAHQLMRKVNQDRTIALVESEKTAVIGTACEPSMVWMACGGLSQLSAERCIDIHGKKVVLFPDTDEDGSTYRLWCEKARELEKIGCKVTVSDLLEKRASSEDRKAKIDIGDLMIRELQEKAETYGQRRLRHMAEENPALGLLTDKLGLEPYEEDKT